MRLSFSHLLFTIFGIPYAAFDGKNTALHKDSTCSINHNYNSPFHLAISHHNTTLRILIKLITIFCLVILAGQTTVYAANPPIHQVGVRTNSTGKQEFYDTVTNLTLQFRGNEYLRSYSLLPPGENTYNPLVTTAALDRMVQDGYNAVRPVGISIGSTLDPDGSGLSAAGYYPIMDFLKQAYAHNIYAFLTLTYVPIGGGYAPPGTDRYTCRYNTQILVPSYYWDAKRRYLQDVIRIFKENQVPMEVLIGITIENEIYFDPACEPLNLTSGLYTAANGKTYNLSISSQKTALLDETLIDYMNSMRNAIREVEPNLMVGMSLMSQHTIDPKVKLVRTASLINNSQADWFDLHYYPIGQSLSAEMNAYSSTPITKPLLMGEFGAYPHYYPTLQEGAIALRDTQVESCNAYNFQGWFVYDYDAYEYDPKFRIYHTMEGDGAINNALAPKYRADPCSTNAVEVIGHFDSISTTGLMKGWVYDPEQPEITIINFFLDSALPNSDWSNLVGRTKVGLKRQDVQTSNSWMTTSNIGFNFQIPMGVMTDSKSHTIYARSTNKTQAGIISSYLIPGSGKAVPKITPTPIVAIPCSGSVPAGVCAPQSGTYKIAVTSISGASSVLFATWNTTDGLDDQVNYTGVNTGSGNWEATITRASHPGIGTMNSNVWIKDAAGTSIWCTQISLPICSSASPPPTPTRTPTPSHSPAASYTPFPTMTTKPGDANTDNRVDGLDYVIWLNHYGGVTTGVTSGDFNADNRIDGLDYVIWLNHYGS